MQQEWTGAGNGVFCGKAGREVSCIWVGYPMMCSIPQLGSGGYPAEGEPDIALLNKIHYAACCYRFTLKRIIL